jgi:hypothetical protein
MTWNEPTSKPTAQWLRAIPRAQRWQAMQTLLSQHAGTGPSAWMRRSTSSCKWRALPAGVSAQASRAGS